VKIFWHPGNIMGWYGQSLAWHSHAAEYTLLGELSSSWKAGEQACKLTADLQLLKHCELDIGYVHELALDEVRREVVEFLPKRAMYLRSGATWQYELMDPDGNSETARSGRPSIPPLGPYSSVTLAGWKF
jgi:hypothetical protein